VERAIPKLVDFCNGNVGGLEQGAYCFDFLGGEFRRAVAFSARALWLHSNPPMYVPG